MLELQFSLYGDMRSPLEDPEFILKDFMQKSNCSVKVERLAWDAAWPKLLGFALYGGGPHISQIGSIWTSTLVSMDVLRPFSPKEIRTLGGSEVFFPAVRQDAMFTETAGAWAIPSNAFVYLVFYRRDLLDRAGVDERAAFATPLAMLETVEKLKSKGIASPLVLPSGNPYRSRIHMLASWVWGAGGDFISSDGCKILFAEPPALKGLEEFFSLYRYVNSTDRNLTYEQCGTAFATGQAAITIFGSSAQHIHNSLDSQQANDPLGVATLPGIPWVGGASLVIWKETQMQLEMERTALALVNFLSTPTAQVRLSQAGGRIPCRIDAMEQFSPQYPALKPAMHQSLLNGRSYHPVPHWVRIMSALREAFDAITSEAISYPTLDIKSILDAKLTPLAARFRMMLSK